MTKGYTVLIMMLCPDMFGKRSWVGNALVFANWYEARNYGRDFNDRCFGIDEWKIVETDKVPSYKYRDGKASRITDEDREYEERDFEYMADMSEENYELPDREET